MQADCPLYLCFEQRNYVSLHSRGWSIAICRCTPSAYLSLSLSLSLSFFGLSSVAIQPYFKKMSKVEAWNFIFISLSVLCYPFYDQCMSCKYTYLFVSCSFNSVWLPYLLECKTFKFGAEVFEVVVNSHMKCCTRPCKTRLRWTGPCLANKGLHPQIFMCRWKREQSMMEVV